MGCNEVDLHTSNPRLTTPSRDHPSLFSHIPLHHPKKKEIECVVRTVLGRHEPRWDCEIVILGTGAWFILLACSALKFECGFRVEIEKQDPSHIGGWIARLVGASPDAPGASATGCRPPPWPREGFATYAERRVPRLAGAVAYSGIERRRAGGAVR